MKLHEPKDLAALVAQAARIRKKLAEKSDRYRKNTGDENFNTFDSIEVFYEQLEIALDELKEEIENTDWELPNGD